MSVKSYVGHMASLGRQPSAPRGGPSPAQTAGRLRRLAGPLLVMATAALLAGCAANASPSPVATTKVDLPKSYKFSPADITVTAGATVTWTNDDNFTHSVSFPGEQPQVMKPGESTTKVFATPGTYPYVCSFHPNDMKGVVVVTSG